MNLSTLYLLHTYIFVSISLVSSQPYPEFLEAIDASSGQANGTSAMDAGDIDGDGLVDVVVVGGKFFSNTTIFSWFKAPKDPNGEWIEYKINPNNQLRKFLGSTRLGDFDNDGDLDLAIASDNHSGDTREADVYVYINPGKSSVKSHWNSERATAKTQPWHHLNDMQLDDMDNDGKLDIVTRSLHPNAIHIFFQNSLKDWTLKSIASDIPLGEGLSLGDLDGDNNVDIVYSGHWLQAKESPRSQSYTKFRIDADFYLTNPTTKGAIGDLDGDDLPDVLIAPGETYRGGKDHHFAWYKNPGKAQDVEWEKNIIIKSTNRMHQVKVGDMDLDGDLDVVTGQAWSPFSVNVHYNDGKGKFSSPQVLTTKNGLYASTVIDADGDGDLDIFGTNAYGGNSKPWLYLNLLDPDNVSRSPRQAMNNQKNLVEWVVDKSQMKTNLAIKFQFKPLIRIYSIRGEVID